VSARSDTVLAGILRSTRETVQQRKHAHPLGELEALLAERPREARGQPGRLHAALQRPGIGVIAEFKRRSPSAGQLLPGAQVDQIVRAYERGGARALSILTEEANFDGSLEDLRAARAASALPILRKDFIVDPYQLYEALLAGADAVLLIVAALEPQQLATLHQVATELALETIVEVHDRGELDVALDVRAEIIGINNRDLRDFTVDVERTARLAGDIPAGVAIVSESGIASPEQLERLDGLGVHAVLVGEALMRAGDPERALGTLLPASPPTRGRL
jgi:indole-3-glycerol phosphate synthase